MKTIILIIISIGFNNYSYAQWQWTQHFGGNSFNSPDDISANLLSDGNYIFSVGEYGGPLYMPNDTLPFSGVNQIYITKFTSSGTQVWAQSLGGNYNQFLDYEYSYGALDQNSNSIYLSGVVIGDVSFGGITSYSSSGLGDIFLAKMDFNGNYSWVERVINSGYDRSKIFLSPSGKIYLIIQTEDSSQFGNFSLPPGGSLVEYNSSGICMGATHKFNAPMFANQNDVRLSFLDHDLFYFGRFRSSTFQLDTFNLTNNGTSDAFIARADSNGNVKWVKHFGNAGADYIEDIAISNNYLYAIGGFQDSINFGGNSLYNTGQDVFFTKFDTAGNTIWARNLFCTGATSSGNKIVVDNDGNTYVTGSFSGTASFGNFQLTTTNPSDMFLARYDSAGNCLGVKNFQACQRKLSGNR
ncbi:MAG: hypothetical protein IPP71_18360 [Bacteroidetes bacterium]|nr:hypothetical protein [Bacteroidota bacterium]